jgi:signal transduction histidine kinase
LSTIIDSGSGSQTQPIEHTAHSWFDISEKIPLGMILLDEHGGIISINRHALEIFDINRNEVILAGDNSDATIFVETLPVESQDYWQSQIMIVMGTGDPTECARYFHHTGYEQKILSYRISRVIEQDSRHPMIALVVWDVTEQVAREKYVILSEKLVARGELAATIAGQLEDYLQKMSANADLIKSSLAEGKSQGAELNAGAIIETIDAVREYIRVRLDYAEPETAFILYDLRLLIEELLMTISRKPRFRDIVFTVDLASNMPLIEMDVAQIQYLIKNLVNNAADTLEEKRQKVDNQFEKRISIEAVWDNAREQVSISVTDNGMGITDAVQKKMFNLHFSTKKVSRGLGLYRCQQVVDRHDGQLIVKSTLGEGTEFTVILPRTSRG